MQKKNYQAKRRCGIASIEYVLSFPILMLVFVALLFVGRGGIEKSQANFDVRYEVWKSRGPEVYEHGKPTTNWYRPEKLVAFEANRDTEPLQLLSLGEELRGELHGRADRDFRFPVFGGRTASAQTTVIHGTWDHEELPMFSDDTGRPHTSLVGTILGTERYVPVFALVDEIFGFVFGSFF